MLPCALVLAGCGGLKKGSIFNEKFMEKNFGNVVTKTHEFAAPELLELNFEEGVAATHTAQQDLFQISKDGVNGLYNVLTNTYPVPLSIGITSDFEFKSASTGAMEKDPSVSLRVLHGTKVVEGRTILFIFDDYGNKLYEGDDGDVTLTAIRISRNVAEEKEKTELKVKIDGVVQAVARYNVDGSFKDVLSREEYYRKNPHTQFGSSLADFGHKELRYKVVDNGDQERCVVFNTETEQYVLSFDIPTGAKYWMIGDKIVYQVQEELPERAEDYDYSAGDSKYLLSTYSVDYLTGKVKSLKTNLVLSVSSDDTNYFNEEGVYKFKLFDQVKAIGRDKVLSDVARDVILDEDLKELADVTGVGFDELVKIGEKRYANKNSMLIYDEKLREVGKIRGTMASSLPIIRQGGRYGLMNHDGEFIELPVYKSIVKMGEDGFYCLELDNSWKFVKLNENEEIEVIKEISKDEYTLDGRYYKYASFTRKSEEKSVGFDATTGQEVAVPSIPEDALWQFGEGDEIVRVASTIKAQLFGFKKDGKYLVLRITDKSNIDFSESK